MIIFPDNYIVDISAASLTPSSESTYLPSDNMQDPSPGKAWMTDESTTTHTLTIDFITAQTITGAAVLFKTITESVSSITVAFSTDGSSWTGTQTLTTGDSLAIKTFASVSYRYAKFTITLSGADDIYIHQAYLGAIWTPDNKQQLGYSLDYDERSSQLSNNSGQLYSASWPGIYKVKFSTSFVTEAERENWIALAKVTGGKKYLFMALDYTNYPTTQTLYGKFTKTGGQKLVAAGAAPYWKNEDLEFWGIREIEE